MKSFKAAAVSALRKHRWCGDQYPENSWPEINKALALYALEKHKEQGKQRYKKNH